MSVVTASDTGRPAGTIYAAHATPEFSARLGEALERLARDVIVALGEDLVALVLGGGYGRGEGGIVRVDDVERAYNDLDLTIVVRPGSRWIGERLRAPRERCQAELGVEVDFSRPLTLSEIRRWPPYLMWYDLLGGHIVLTGAPDVLLSNAPSGVREPLGAIEATKLLLNRGAGLLWALCVAKGVFPEPDPDFVRRNRYKCALALGDAVLIAHRRYTTRYRGRDELVAALSDSTSSVRKLRLEDVYPDALAFKFCPDDLSPEVPRVHELERIAERWVRTFLHVEGLRTGRMWSDVAEYSAWRGCRDRAMHRLRELPRNLLRNARIGRCSLRHPREDLFRTLPRLLDVSDTPVGAFGAEARAFLEVWRRYD